MAAAAYQPWSWARWVVVVDGLLGAVDQGCQCGRYSGYWGKSASIWVKTAKNGVTIKNFVKKYAKLDISGTFLFKRGQIQILLWQPCGGVVVEGLMGVVEWWWREWCGVMRL